MGRYTVLDMLGGKDLHKTLQVKSPGLNSMWTYHPYLRPQPQSLQFNVLLIFCWDPFRIVSDHWQFFLDFALIWTKMATASASIWTIIINQHAKAVVDPMSPLYPQCISIVETCCISPCGDDPTFSIIPKSQCEVVKPHPSNFIGLSLIQVV